ncbi:MAG: GldG family protein [Halobacteriovoraceae bacterium]|nr:GldG family protein [Halobacteriovoraceae bacterium]
MTLMIYIGTTLLKRARVDFTQENLYTLSKGTKSILSKLDSPIKLKLYYSKTAANKGTEGLRAFNNHFLYVQDLLRQYTSHSRNNLTLEVIDPRPDTPEEEDALAYGLKKFNLTETERYFFGLVAENESGTENYRIF